MSEEQQPRQPKNLQGLLHFCTSVTANEDAPNKSSAAVMDPERQNFLREVMSTMTQRADKEMTEKVYILMKSEARKLVDVADTDVEENALEYLLELVQDIDNANDLVKMGGVKELVTLLSEFKQCNIVSLLCEVLGAISQNNPNSQQEMLNLGVLISLMDMTTDGNKQWNLAVRVKAFFAVSCIIRGHDGALESFHDLSGFSWLMSVLRSGEEKLAVKAMFLVQHLLHEYQPAREHLMSLGYAELLIRLLCYGNFSGRTSCNVCMNRRDQVEQEHEEDQEGYNPYREHCTSALLKLCSVSEEARDICTNYARLTNTLKDRQEQIQGKEEHQEEVDYINQLLKLFATPLPPRGGSSSARGSSLMAVGTPAC